MCGPGRSRWRGSRSAAASTESATGTRPAAIGAGRSCARPTPTGSLARSRSTWTGETGSTPQVGHFASGVVGDVLVVVAVIGADVAADLSARSRAVRPAGPRQPASVAPERRGDRAVARRRARPRHLAVIGASPLPDVAPRPGIRRREGSAAPQPVREGPPAAGPGSPDGDPHVVAERRRSPNRTRST